MQPQNSNKSSSSSSGIFNGVLDTIDPDYMQKPPSGPQKELPTLSKDELLARNYSDFGEDKDRPKNYSIEYMRFDVEERLNPKFVELPDISQFDDIHFYGISGANTWVDKSAFYFLLAKGSIISFRYSKEDKKPYFYKEQKTANGVFLTDDRIFNERVMDLTAHNLTGKSDKNILSEISEDNRAPFLFGMDTERGKTLNPSSHALGWAVKLQQALEIACLQSVPTDKIGICIKRGPLFSNSISPEDTVNGLSIVLNSWKDQALVSFSSDINDSRLLIEALTENKDLRKVWFPGQELTDERLNALPRDRLILPFLLEPGQRTPLIEAYARQRKKIVQGDIDTGFNGDARLSPITCYYRRRTKPYKFIRIEVMRYLFDTKRELMESAIKAVVWQFELGKIAPLVQMAAEEISSLNHEKFILDKLTTAKLYNMELGYLGDI